MGEISREQWRRFHYGHLQINKPKKPTAYVLIDGFNNVFAQGAYALCVYVQKKQGLERTTKIKPVL